MKMLSYANFALAQGVPRKAVFSGTDLSIDDLQSPDKLIGYDDARQLLSNLARHCPADTALRLGSGTRQIDMGIVGHAMLSCCDMHQIAEMWVKYSEVIGFPLKFKSIIDESGWTLEFIPVFMMSEPGLQFCLEDAISCLFPLIQEVTDEPFRPKRLELTISKPANAALYRQYVQTPIHFSAPRSGFTINAEFLDSPVIAGNREMLAICDANCSAILQHLHSAASVVQRIRDLLLTCRGDIPSLEQAASDLGCSKRTLSRRLGCAHRQTQRD